MFYSPDTLRAAGLDPTGLIFPGNFPPYDPSLVSLARDLRNGGTKSEAYLWQVLKHRRLGYKFSRQKPIYRYIADFYCHELSLVVEIDGASHNVDGAWEHDRRRDRDMEALGLRVVRLLDGDVVERPLPAVQRIFHSAGVPLPDVVNRMSDGSERLWMHGYMGRFENM